MIIRDLINKLESEKNQLLAENKVLKEENAELKRINKKLVDDLNSHIKAESDIVEDKPNLDGVLSNIVASAIEPDDVQKRGIPVDDDAEEPKPKKSRRKKTDVDEVINLM